MCRTGDGSPQNNESANNYKHGDEPSQGRARLVDELRATGPSGVAAWTVDLPQDPSFSVWVGPNGEQLEVAVGCLPRSPPPRYAVGSTHWFREPWFISQHYVRVTLEHHGAVEALIGPGGPPWEPSKLPDAPQTAPAAEAHHELVGVPC